MFSMSKIPLPNARRILLFFIAGIALVGFGFWLGQQGIKVTGNFPQVTLNRELPPEKNLNFSLFWDVWDILHSNYLQKEKLNDADLVYGAIKGMVQAAGDPYSVFLSPQEQKRTTEDLGGSFEGVGIQIGFKGTQLAVIAPLDGTPAKAAGLQAGDFILFIKDERRDIEKSTIGIDLPSAVDAIRGPAGTTVTLTISREGVNEPFEVTVARAKIDVPSVEISFLDDPTDGSRQVAHLKLLRFGETTDAEWGKAVSEIIGKTTGVTGIILDLRNNPGGFLSGSVSIASEFIRSGTIVIQEGSSGERQNFPATGRARLNRYEVVVLVNKGSASASEIVAGALRDVLHFRLIGETTFGKGTIQEAQELTGGAGLHITTAKWLTPNGTWVNEKGLDPDSEIEDNPDTEDDEQLQKAVEELTK
ncbi:S41 family peptidase [Candidatus Microgenomates bacterium]|nr:S41 family peptidase [Candidatus Microgenomates bacterium]